MDIKIFSESFKLWADSKCIIRRAWIFGSVVRGDFNPNSDLDIAISTIASDKITINLSIWKKELEELIFLKFKERIPVHICPYDGRKTFKVNKGIQEASTQIYSSALPSGVEDTGSDI